jgi:hypothetical protein
MPIINESSSTNLVLYVEEYAYVKGLKALNSSLPTEGELLMQRTAGRYIYALEKDHLPHLNIPKR